MINTGKCPKCNQIVSTISIENVIINAGFGRPSWEGIAYLCQYCNTVLSVQIDPVSLKTDLINELLKALGR